MAEEGKGVALAILGVVAVIAVVGLVLLFAGATGKVSAPYQKLYGGVHYGEQYPYLSDRTTGGMANTAGVPDAIYYPAGFYTEKPVPVELQEDAGYYGETIAGERLSSNRQGHFVPSGQNDPCGSCPQGTYCIPDSSQAEASGWEPVGGGCYAPA